MHFDWKKNAWKGEEVKGRKKRRKEGSKKGRKNRRKGRKDKENN